ncbi:PREDICTED: phosphatidate phosphatase PAH2-like [Nelumbo nucifera]|uniref:phosphatidate phosphatase n=2 Tax=Nelumbo nucifera TaxID=4432 RepID=A0A1U8B0I4_NELNU|nr:PREDICTED: phosphatidate phosphatase PAH2-like [Nelumbo nucifera]XP_010269340.1 PREDICTED: phosphatidate phosphatase PAH2-like [Nelumbo nucifera]XP_010269350.1 PREDICTED: phosphatidate phosphatase PAH2-like [Nelumbo nucifera]DAD41243.1 TPA_asm: hypothetical protein HUJ06_015566 [Nelumbo nucifera]
MQAVGRLGSYISRGVYTVSGPFHPFGGAVDIIVVQQQDGSFKSSPWYVRFGKFQGVLKTREKVVTISVNEAEAGFHMYLDHKGEAYFLKEVDSENGDFEPSFLSSGEETDEQSFRGGTKESQSCNSAANQPTSVTPIDASNGKIVARSQSCNFASNHPASVTPIDASNGKIVTRTNSRRQRILGLFRRKSSKEDSRAGDGGSVGMERVSSLERAELAADLMEVKWSTNLFTNKPGASTTMQAMEINGDLQVTDGNDPGSQSLHDNVEKDVALPVVHVETTTCDNSGYELGNTEISDGVTSHYSKPQDQPVETSISEAGELDKHDVTSEVSTCQETMSESLSENAVPDLQHLDLVELEVTPNTHLCIKQYSETKILLNNAIPEEDCGNERVHYYIYSETSESSNVRMDESCQSVETTEISHGGFEEVQTHAEIPCESARIIPEVRSEPEYDLFSAKENLNNIECPGETGSSEILDTGTIMQSEHSAVDPVLMNTVTECVSSIDTCPVTVDADESAILEVFHQDKIADYLTQKKNLKTERLEVSEDGFQKMEISYSDISSNNEVNLGKPSMAIMPPPETLSVDCKLVSIAEAEMQNICTPSRLDNLICEVQEKEYFVEYNKMGNLCSSLKISTEQVSGVGSVCVKAINSSIPPLESPEENQFLFSDIDNFVERENRRKELMSPDSMGTGSYPFITLEDIEDEHEAVIKNHESSSSSDNLLQGHLPEDFEGLLGKPMTKSSPISIPRNCMLETTEDEHESVNKDQDLLSSEEKPLQEHSPSDFNGLLEDSMTKSSPISIPRSHKGVGEDTVRLIESLPNIRSLLDNLEGSDVVNHLSHSLDSNSGNFKWGFLRNDASNSLKTDTDSEHNLVQDQLELEDTQTSGKLGNVSINSGVEISLCRHLLHEGMGDDAASQAFDAEKVDLDKFTSLDPDLVKNDRLVIRIGGRYFPWDAAAPIVLGMGAFEHQQIFEPEGIIAVNKVKRTNEVDASRAIVPSGGSWKLWPFSFRRSKTMSSVQLSQGGTEASDAANPSEKTHNMIADKNECTTAKVTKKKVRSIVPTSEQLATLDLKEGQNMITFTFSTAMLGKQQVDARIYLWKWNTRIVVSDVDGTITKSDVLGQFMPLVGRDWSQTGVAHLFSAIKENGYQLLFLSARSISQAYLTRQFLFNLKQDGKALPDGPVVISPDGLFPSLYREVIRRAPHEFKITCLEDIRALFPHDCNPFYAGFGNRDTDEISYLKVGIPKGKIFIINPKGEVAVNRSVDTKSYTSLHALVNGMFPAMSSSEQEDFNSWNYWKMPLPNINI